jgi:hypothetical protein
MFWMFGSLHYFPGARQCHNRSQLNKICPNVVSDLKFAYSKAHSWPCVDPIKNLSFDETSVAHPSCECVCECVCLSPVWVCPCRQLWSGPEEWTPEALRTNSRFGIRAWLSRGIGTQIFEDENMSWEWALKFSTLNKSIEIQWFQKSHRNHHT